MQLWHDVRRSFSCQTCFVLMRSKGEMGRILGKIDRCGSHIVYIGHNPFPVSITLKNPYGYLDAADYPAMVFYAVMLVMYLFLAVVWDILCCCYYKDLIRLQVWVWVWVGVYACVGEVGLCMCAFWNPNVQMRVSVYLCLCMQQVQLHECYVYAANHCQPVMPSTSCSSSDHPSF